MERIDPRQLSDAILTAPGWARVGITMPDQHMRQRAADELAATIVERLTRADQQPDRDQLSLPI